MQDEQAMQTFEQGHLNKYSAIIIHIILLLFLHFQILQGMFKLKTITVN